MISDEIKKRTKWAINYIIEKENLSNVKLAERLAVGVGTINNYRQMLAEPKGSFLVAFSEAFNFSLRWFFLGIGEPYPGARKEFPEACGSEEYDVLGREESLSSVSDQSDSYSADAFGHAVRMLKELFDSDNPMYVSAITAHLRALTMNARAQQENTELHQRINELNGRLQRIEKMLDQQMRDKADKE
ncbi:MAG TPA: helix-turn-helix transcriptional regulator [Thermodesulfobacteriota bacterium]|nr:helix-turn-helix transcriptional regulator [Thermodesulfobacteriota bacterium]